MLSVIESHKGNLIRHDLAPRSLGPEGARNVPLIASGDWLCGAQRTRMSQPTEDMRSGRDDGFSDSFSRLS